MIEIFDLNNGIYNVTYRIDTSGTFKLQVKVNGDAENLKESTITVIPNEASVLISTVAFNKIVTINSSENVLVNVFDSFGNRV